jgi:4-oxalocrotonate tautomerase
MNRYQQNVASIKNILGLVTLYFDGLHHADTEKLRAIFHPDTVLKAPGLRRGLNEWLDAVSTRPIPAEINSPYDYNIVSLEVHDDEAMVKVECPLFDYFYVDYLGLLRENNQWLIVNKMYTDIKHRK